ncbi:uncharacterized protein [Rutidosis leptorrhynchoides]|uniref:uncharacterized protein n=1 Tax=Rutidosis leptorrhynchoides TaxID=125765 RepID=UPI003A9939E1
MDIWKDGVILKDKFLRLFHLEADKECKLSDRLVQGAWSWNWVRNFQGSRTATQLDELVSFLGNTVLTQSDDSWTWSLTTDEIFKVCSTRNYIDSRVLTGGSLSTKWVRSLPRKVNVFIWRVALNRLPTSLNISARGMEINDIRCLVCPNWIESVSHVLFTCDIAIDIWRRIRIWVDVLFSSFEDWAEYSEWEQGWNASAGSKLRLYNIFAASTLIL